MEDPRERILLDRFCSALAGSRVLELGCGGGAILGRLVDRGLRRHAGFDVVTPDDSPGRALAVLARAA